MFTGNATLHDYREMNVLAIFEEFLLYKGTFDATGNPINKTVSPNNKDLISSGLFVYGLKDNPTNRKSISYYCERTARRNLAIVNNMIVIPIEIWNKCDEYNKQHCKKEAMI